MAFTINVSIWFAFSEICVMNLADYSCSITSSLLSIMRSHSEAAMARVTASGFLGNFGGSSDAAYVFKTALGYFLLGWQLGAAFISEPLFML